MKKIDRRIVVVFTLIFIIGLAYGLMRFLIAQKEDPAMRPQIEARRYVKADTVKYSTVISPVSAPGRVSSISEIDVVAEASGKIIPGDVPLKRGEVFTRGTVLFTIYPDEAALALKARKSQFLNSLANLLPDIAIDFPQHGDLFNEFFNSIDLEAKLPHFPETNDEKLRIFLASRNILSEYYNIQKDELQLSRHSVRAPFDGTYDQVFMEAGAYTNTGGRVAHAIRTDLLELEVPLERFDADWVKIGDPVTIFSDREDFIWTGEVIRKSQFVDENTQSQIIFVRVNNHQRIPLLVGEYPVAEFPGHPVDNAMEVPRNVCFNTNEVFLIVDGRLKKNIINIIKENETTLLFNGLEEGVVLVMQPLINVQEGTPVVIQGQVDPKQ
jgi:membrane fusion protein (multidrug efflux system)